MKNKQHEPKFGEVSSKWREIERSGVKGKPVTADTEVLYKLAFYCGVMFAIQMSREFIKAKPTTFARDIAAPGMMELIVKAGWPNLRKDFKRETDAQLRALRSLYIAGGVAAICESMTRVKCVTPAAADALLLAFSNEVYAHIQTMR